MKTLLCCIAKNENRYIREYVEYYKNLGFSNISLYDNNDVDGERFEDVINDYIESGFVRVVDFRGRKCCQWDAYTDCYLRNNKKFDWISFFDCDEFLTLVRDKNIESYLKRVEFKHAGIIHVNWMNYGDSNNVYYEDTKLLNRLTSPCSLETTCAYSFPENYHVKSIVRTGLRNIVWNCSFNNHTPFSTNVKCVDSVGNMCDANSAFQKYNYKMAYLRHYSTKTIDEYCDKMLRGFPDQNWDGSRVKNLIETRFFRCNSITPEKLDVIKEKLNIDMYYLLENGVKSNDVKIYSLCFSKKNFKFIDDKVITPLQVGASMNHEDVCELKDNTGDNISDMNYFYIENTGTYWIWKNIHGCKYKGQMQYRRPLDGVNEDMDFDKIFSEYDVITCKPFNHPIDGKPTAENGYMQIPANTVEEGYSFSNCSVDIKILEQVIKNSYPDYAESYDKYIKNGEDLYYSSGYIMRSEDYDRYCEFLFDILFKWLSAAGINSEKELWFHVGRNLGAGMYVRYGNNPYAISPENMKWQTEIGGFLGERIWTLWLLHNFEENRIYKAEYVKQEAGMYT